MGSVVQRGATWRGEIARRGHRESKTFATRQEAVDWIVTREAELLAAGKTAKHTLAHAIDEFERGRKFTRSEATRLRMFRNVTWADQPVAGLTTETLGAWQRTRLESCKPGTVIRELGTLRAILERARLELKWITVNPLDDLKLPPRPPARKRTISDAERDGVLAALEYTGTVEAIRHEVAVAFLLSLETAMRAGEILGLEWSRVYPRKVALEQTKNGDRREVPLSSRARELLDIMRRRKLLHVVPDKRRVFHVEPDSLDVLFRRARLKAGLDGFTFHDARATAITRLAKVLDIHDLARMTGHRDLRSLLVYYRATADEISERLG